MLRSAQPSQFSTYPIQNIDIPNLAVLKSTHTEHTFVASGHIVSVLIKTNVSRGSVSVWQVAAAVSHLNPAASLLEHLPRLPAPCTCTLHALLPLHCSCTALHCYRPPAPRARYPPWCAARRVPLWRHGQVVGRLLVTILHPDSRHRSWLTLGAVTLVLGW